MMLWGLPLFPMLCAAASYAIGRRSASARDRFAVCAGLAELALCVWLLFLPVQEGRLFGLTLALDGFRRVYCLVAAFLWAMTLLFSPWYFAHHHRRNRYYFFNLMTLGATLGVFLAADLLTAFVFFEIMSFTSYPWVAQEEEPEALRAAETYLAVAVIGGLVALMGLFLLQHTLGTLRLAELYDRARVCQNRGVLYAAGGCILFGFGAKAGMFPLHIWLPKAHPVAPAPASALLSGILTKAGVWGILAISCNIFRYDAAWGCVVLALGTVTMLLGAVLAVFSVDLKRTLACSSMSQIGFILVGIGMMGLLGEQNGTAARGVLLHMVNHSLFKLVLFLCAGVVFVNLHALRLDDIRGFGRKKPLLHAAFLLGAAGIAGVPLLNGFVSKSLLHEAIVEYGGGALMTGVEWIFLFSGGLTAAYMAKLYIALFWEKHPTRQAEFDAMRRYCSPAASVALGLSALTLPVLGLTARFSMRKITEVGLDFFRVGQAEPFPALLTLENLKGAAISLAIGAAVYLLLVRPVLRRNGSYVDLWPKRLDLEELVYRPLLLKILPGALGWVCALFGENKLTIPLAKGVFRAFGVVSHALSDLTDALVLLLRRTIFRPSPIPNGSKTEQALSYRMGKAIDRHTGGSDRYARLFYRAQRTWVRTTHRISGNLSFALLLFCAALVAAFVYLLLLR